MSALSNVLVFALAALAAALAGAWVLRAYVRGAPKDAAAPKPLAPLVAVSVAAVLSLGLYVLVGRPDLPGQPLAGRLEALKAKDLSTLTPNEAMALLTARAREAPRDPRPYFFMGQLLASGGDLEKAAENFEIALMRDPTHGPSALELARVRVQLARGEITPQALELFRAAAALDPQNPLPWFYQALAATSSERWDDAKVFWAEAQKRFPKEDPRQMMIAQMRAEAETKARGAQR